MIVLKYKILIPLYVLLSLICVWGFKPFAKDAITYTMLAQDKQKTTEKYAAVWDNRTIIEASYSKRSYDSGEIVGYLTIPKMEYYEMPIYYGSDKINNNWQITTVGYPGNWEMFGEKGVAAVGAHNYQLFKNLEVLKPGDLFLIENDENIFIYEVTGSTIYDHTKDDWTQMSYRDAEDYSVSLMTCYPIVQGAEATQDTYIVYSKMVCGTKYGEKILS